MTLGCTRRSIHHFYRYLRHVCIKVSKVIDFYVILGPSGMRSWICGCPCGHGGGDGRLRLLRYNFVDRRVILDYVKRDAAHFCRYLRDPRLRKKRRGAFLSLFTVLQSIMTEISAIFAVIYTTFASMTCVARHFCRSLRDPSLRKKRYASHLSLFTGL